MSWNRKGGHRWREKRQTKRQSPEAKAAIERLRQSKEARDRAEALRSGLAEFLKDPARLAQVNEMIRKNSGLWGRFPAIATPEPENVRFPYFGPLRLVRDPANPHPPGSFFPTSHPLTVRKEIETRLLNDAFDPGETNVGPTFTPTGPWVDEVGPVDWEAISAKMAEMRRAEKERPKLIVLHDQQDASKVLGGMPFWGGYKVSKASYDDATIIPIGAFGPDVIVFPLIARTKGEWFAFSDPAMCEGIKRWYERWREAEDRKTFERMRNDAAALNFARWVEDPTERYRWDGGAHVRTRAIIGFQAELSAGFLTPVEYERKVRELG